MNQSLETAESMCFYCHLLDEKNKATGGRWERFKGLPTVAKHMALTFICHVCATANKKIVRADCFENQNYLIRKRVKEGKRHNIQRMGECFLRQFLSDVKGRTSETALQGRGKYLL